MASYLYQISADIFRRHLTLAYFNAFASTVLEEMCLFKNSKLLFHYVEIPHLFICLLFIYTFFNVILSYICWSVTIIKLMNQYGSRSTNSGG